ncbi:MAG TPA: hypothetical protein VFS90_03645, partial [Pyrinomonadaceae bacterium]|nr:hypothetical protein [Pyrinomonadaceae bacterium]
LDRIVRLVSISRTAAIVDAVPHAANGLAALLSSIAQHRRGLFSYEVPPEHTDGFSTVNITLEIS